MEKSYKEVNKHTGAIRRTVLITEEQAKEMNTIDDGLYVYELIKEKPEPKDEPETKKPGRPKAE